MAESSGRRRPRLGEFPKWKKRFETAEHQAEVLVTKPELKFFADFSTREGFTKALAVARVLNQPHVNVRSPKGRMSEARLRKAEAAHHSEVLPGPELGGFEYHTAEIMARQFEKSVHAAEKEGLKGDVSILVVDKGERRWMGLEEYVARREQGTEGLLVAGVIGRMTGDDSEGANILIRNDMDALQMASGEVKHQCGHNVHSGWATTNMDALIEYRKKFGTLPFKQVVFVSESNEEANPAAGDFIAPKEMVEGGFEERYGQIDFALGAHVIASIPEHTARIEVEGFHGATDFVFTVKPSAEYDPEKDADINLLPYEVARLINQEFHSDTPSEKFGKRRLVADDDGKIVPPVYVRLTAEGRGDANMALNSLPGKVEYAGRLDFPMDKLGLEEAVAEQLRPWHALDFTVEPTIQLNEETGDFSIALSTGSAAHVAFGGPNARQILAEILHSLPQSQSIRAPKGTTPAEFRFGGTMRIRLPESEKVRDEAAGKLQQIYARALENLSLQGKLEGGFVTQNSIGPVINDPEMVQQARAVFTEAGIPLSRTNLPHAGAESFVEYERFFKPGDRKAMIYILIGGMKTAEVNRLLETGDPVEASCVHHSDTFEVEDSSIPYGVALDALAIQYAKDFKQKKGQ